MIKFLLELGPIVVFFATYKYSNILNATLLMVIVTAICLAASYFIYKKISPALMVSGILLLISGSITVISGDPKYIKMKPTIVYIIFSSVLMYSAYKNIPIVENMFSNIISMDNKYWNILTKRIAYFFIFLAIINEMTWRLCSESFWVNFKVFGVTPLTLLFLLSQIPFIMKYRNK